MTVRHWHVLLLAVTPLTALADDRPKADPVRVAAFEPNKVWDVHVTLTAAEFEAMRPRGGFNMFGPPQPKAKAPEKPLDPNREVHKNTEKVVLPWATGTVTSAAGRSNVGVRTRGTAPSAMPPGAQNRSKSTPRPHGGTGKFRNEEESCTAESRTRQCRNQAMRSTGRPASPPAGLAEVRLPSGVTRNSGVYT